MRRDQMIYQSAPWWALSGGDMVWLCEQLFRVAQRTDPAALTLLDRLDRPYTMTVAVLELSAPMATRAVPDIVDVLPILFDAFPTMQIMPDS